MSDHLPLFFRLPFYSRLLLAVLSGLPMEYAFDHWETAFLIEGLLLGCFVLTPGLTVRSMLLLRISAATGMGVLGTWALLYLTLALETLSEATFDGFGFVAGPIIVTLILLIFFAWLSAFTMTRRLLGVSLVVSLCAGLGFYIFLSRLWSWLCFDPCPWWNDLAFSAGWIVWHVAMCSGIYFGSGSTHQTT